MDIYARLIIYKRRDAVNSGEHGEHGDNDADDDDDNSDVPYSHNSISTSESSITPISTSIVSPVTSMPSRPLNSSISSTAPASTSSASSHDPGDSSAGKGAIIGSLIGAVVALLLLLTLAWLAIRKWCARRRGTTQAHHRKPWGWRKDPARPRRREMSTEYRKAELDATETAVGYNTGAPHEFYVPRIGHEKPAELNALRSPVELAGSM
ncbi:hypothetical protein F5Y12DRAFT_791742 [Xylaria sp. FL1777]|nr:hypothetical protein F5Y12DRAFT_791742 [Xylaria sp. FL1777]